MITKKWVVLLILFHKGKVSINRINIFTSLAKISYSCAHHLLLFYHNLDVHGIGLWFKVYPSLLNIGSGALLRVSSFEVYDGIVS